MVRSRTRPTRGALASLFHGLLPNQFHIKTQSHKSQFISQVLQSDIIISILDQFFLNPRSLVEQMKLIHTNMDSHYDNIAAVLAKYRSAPSPSEKLLYSTDAILPWIKHMIVTQFPLKGVLGVNGVRAPFTPRTPFKGNIV